MNHRKYDSVAVVGHGPSWKLPGAGDLVDACDVVVRLWDGERRGVKCGTRYDYGLIRQIWRMDPRVVRVPEIAWIGYEVALDEFIGKPVLHAFYGTFWDGRKMSRGAVALCFVLNSFQPKDLYLVGFDDVLDATYREHWPHDNPMEHDLVYRLAQQRDVRIIDVRNLCSGAGEVT